MQVLSKQVVTLIISTASVLQLVYILSLELREDCELNYMLLFLNLLGNFVVSKI